MIIWQSRHRWGSKSGSGRSRISRATLLVRWIGDSYIFQFLHHWTHRIRMSLWSHRFVLYRKLLLGQHPPNSIYKCKCIFLCPEVDIECVEPVQISVLVLRIECRKMPFLCIRGRRTIVMAIWTVNGQRDQRRVVVGVLDMCTI